MKVLPFYTATGMRDAERVGSQDALLCPTWKILPFQIQRLHLDDTYLTEIKLVDCDAGEIDIFNYFFGSSSLMNSVQNSAGGTAYGTYADSGTTILTAVEAASGLAFAYSNTFLLATGYSVVVQYNLTLNSGDLPSMLLSDSSGTLYSEKIQTAAGANTMQLTATGNAAGVVTLNIENAAGDDTSFACTFSKVSRNTVIAAERTSYDFITYNGTPLSTPIPYGVYYIRASDGNATWYSEWINVQSLQPQLLTSWPTETYNTFTTTGPNINSAFHAGGAAVAFTNTFSARDKEIFIFAYNMELNSGVAPFVEIFTDSTNSSNIETLSVGPGEVELVLTGGSTAAVLRIATLDTTNYSVLNVSLRRKAGDYVHIEYTNSKDFDNADDSILYTSTGGFTQQAYLRAYENLPSHESIEVGADKNGEFVAEKMIRKYTRSIIAYVSRSMYNALSLLKHHTTIKILDEVGNEYLPEVGNVDVGIDWNTFDTGSLRITFNEKGDVWTNSMGNII